MMAGNKNAVIFKGVCEVNEFLFQITSNFIRWHHELLRWNGYNNPYLNIRVLDLEWREGRSSVVVRPQKGFLAFSFFNFSILWKGHFPCHFLGYWEHFSQNGR